MLRSTKFVSAGFAIVMLAGQGAAFAAPGTWAEPTGGYSSVYIANENNTTTANVGRLPSQAYSGSETNRPTYTATNFTAPAAASIVAAPAPDNRVLDLVQTITTSSLHQENGAATSGTNVDSNQITIDMRIRFPTDNDTTRQFSIFLDRDAEGVATTPEQAGVLEQQFQIHFDTTANGAAFGLSVDAWHDVRITIDADQIEDASELTQFAKVYVDGSGTPLGNPGTGANYSTAFGYAEGTTNTRRTIFGDGNSGATSGNVQLAFFKVTNNEIAAVPEPTTFAVGAIAAACLAGRRRRLA